MLHSTAIGQLTNRAIEHATGVTTEHLTRSFQHHARALGWPERVVSSARVTHDGDQFGVNFPDHTNEDAMDLEYGTQSTPPAAAIRQFNNRLDLHNGGVFETSLMGYAESVL